MAPPTFKASWTLLHTSPSLQRSSQVLSVIFSKAHLFFGELQPRTPVSSDIHVINLDAPPPSSLSTVKPSSGPVPRVGAAGAALNGKIYIFGGRGEKEMTALEEEGGLWEFSSETEIWDLIKPAEGTPYPRARSYHGVAAGAGKVFVHAGCTAEGRLNDLWAFDVASRVWTELTEAPGKLRGGTSICVVGGKFWRMNGFDGKTEFGGSLDCYNIETNTWETYSFTPDSTSGPGARSVSSLLPITLPSGNHLLTLFGERGPSDRGHDGAGQFWEDVWAFDISKKTWSKAVVEGNGPQARGWFDADVWDGKKIVVQGGLNDSNERIGDFWGLELSEI